MLRLRIPLPPSASSRSWVCLLTYSPYRKNNTANIDGEDDMVRFKIEKNNADLKHQWAPPPHVFRDAVVGDQNMSKLPEVSR